MKTVRHVLLLVTIISLLLCTTSCFWNHPQKYFSEDFLSSASLTGLPLPESDKYSMSDPFSNKQTLSFNSKSKNDLKTYANKIFEYLSLRDDIYYFGEFRNEGLVAEMFPYYVVYPIDEGFSYNESYFNFCFALSDGTEKTEDSELLKITGEIVFINLSYDKDEKKYNSYISIEISDSSTMYISQEMSAQ